MLRQRSQGIRTPGKVSSSNGLSVFDAINETRIRGAGAIAFGHGGFSRPLRLSRLSANCMVSYGTAEAKSSRVRSGLELPGSCDGDCCYYFFKWAVGQLATRTMLFIQGESAAGPAVGVGQESSSHSGHTWDWIEGFGNLDVNPRLNERLGQWRPVAATLGTVGSTWVVRGLPVDAVVCQSRQEYDNAIAKAAHLRNAGRAVYRLDREEPFRPGLLIHGAVHINSPRTRRMVELAGKNAYVKLVVHLRWNARTRQPHVRSFLEPAVGI